MPTYGNNNNNNMRPHFRATNNKKHDQIGGFGGGPDSDPLPLPEKVDRWGWFSVFCWIVSFLFLLTLLILISIMFANQNDHAEPCRSDDGRWKCEGPFQGNPSEEECPPILYSPVAFGVEFELCWFGQCTYFKEANPISLDWPCVGPDDTRAELKIHAAKHCLDYISNADTNKTRFQALFVCFGNDGLCIFHEKCSEYSWISDFEIESMGGASINSAHERNIHRRHDRFHHENNNDKSDHLTSESLSMQMSIDDAKAQIAEVKEVLGGRGFLEVVGDEFRQLKAAAAASAQGKKQLSDTNSKSNEL